MLAHLLWLYTYDGAHVTTINDACDDIQIAVHRAQCDQIGRFFALWATF